MCDMKTMGLSDASSSCSDCSLAIAEAGMDPREIRVSLGPVNPGIIRHDLGATTADRTSCP
jgi:hypothetical protein